LFLLLLWSSCLFEKISVVCIGMWADLVALQLCYWCCLLLLSWFRRSWFHLWSFVLFFAFLPVVFLWHFHVSFVNFMSFWKSRVLAKHTHTHTHTHKQQHDSGLLLLLFLREAVRSWLWDFWQCFDIIPCTYLILLSLVILDWSIRGVADKLARNRVSDNVRRILQANYCRGDKSSSWDVVLSHPNNSQERNADNSRLVSPRGSSSSLSLSGRRTLSTEMMMGEIT
jgi:hypothetical protein